MAAVHSDPSPAISPTRTAGPPPLLAPATAAALGASFGWLRLDGRLLILAALTAILILAIIRLWCPQRQMGGPAAVHPLALLLSTACFLFCLLHLQALVRCGEDAQRRLADGIHRETGVVRWIITAPEPGAADVWGRVAIQLPDGALVQLSGKVGQLLPGQLIELQARFSRPQGQRNPGGLDERLLLAQEGIFLKAELFLDRLAIVDPRSDWTGTAVVNVRQALARSAGSILPPAPAALLLGILLGDTSQMEPAEREAFQAAGLSHLTAVSGANVSFLMAPAAFLLARLCRRRRTRSMALIAFVAAFGFLTGWQASVTRAILMAGLALAGRIIMRRTDPLNALLFAVVVMLAARPLLILSLSFHMSFLATAGILLGQKRIGRWLERRLPAWPPALRAAMALNLSVQLTVLPLQLLATGVFSPLTLLSNLPALPLAEGVTLLGAGALLAALILLPLTARLPFLLLILQAAAWPVRILLEALSRLAAIFAADAWPRLLTGRLSLLFLMALAGLSLAILAGRGRRRRRLQLASLAVLAAAVLVQGFTLLNQPDLEIWMLDVGQGDALMIRARDGTTTLIDAGTDAAGRDVVQPALQALGIRRLTQAVGTHGHADHAGGLIQLLAADRIPRLFLSDAALLAAAQTAVSPVGRDSDGREEDVLSAVLNQAARRDIPVQGLQKGDTIPIGSGAMLSVLSPETPASAALASEAARRRGANAGNLVLMLTDATGRFRMLLSGDCDREAEQALIRSGQDLSAGILRVAHHGSAATTGPALLAAVSPQLALISVGRNDFGHPAPALLERLDERALRLARTDRQGAVRIQVHAGTASVTTRTALTLPQPAAMPPAAAAPAAMPAAEASAKS